MKDKKELSEEEKYKYYKKIGIKVIIVLSILIMLFISIKAIVFFLPFMIAYLISCIIEPLIKLSMKKFKWKRKLAATISLIIVFIVVGGLLTLLVSSLISEASNLLPNIESNFTTAYDFMTEKMEQIQSGEIVIPEELMQVMKGSTETIFNVVKNIVISFVTGLMNFVKSVPNMITYTFITILAIIFMCMDKESIKDAVYKHVPLAWIQKAKSMIKEMSEVAVKYIKAEAKLSGMCFILVLVGLSLASLLGIGIPYPVLMAIFIGFMDLLPMIGAGLVMVPWAIYLAIVGNIPAGTTVFVIWLIWCVIKNLLEPKMISKQMGLKPIFTLIAMFIGFRLWGVLGLMVGPVIFLFLKNILGSLFEKGILKSFFELD